MLSAAFSPDGTRLVSVSDDDTLRIWRISWPGLVTFLRTSAQICLTPGERARYLLESVHEARRRYVDCEHGYGREALALPEFQGTGTSAAAQKLPPTR